MFEACAVDHGSGPFVLYNCARLAHLIQTYEEHVEQGDTPSLLTATPISVRYMEEGSACGAINGSQSTSWLPAMI